MLLLNPTGVWQIRQALALLTLLEKQVPVFAMLSEVPEDEGQLQGICQELAARLGELQEQVLVKDFVLQEPEGNLVLPTLIGANSLLSGLLNGLINSEFQYDQGISRLHHSYVTMDEATMQWTHRNLVREKDPRLGDTPQWLDELIIFELLLNEVANRLPLA